MWRTHPACRVGTFADAACLRPNRVSRGLDTARVRAYANLLSNL
jgi:hypothetical protein